MYTLVIESCFMLSFCFGSLSTPRLVFPMLWMTVMCGYQLSSPLSVRQLRRWGGRCPHLRQSHRAKGYYDVMFTVALAYWRYLMLSAVCYLPECLESSMNLCHHRSSVLLLHAASSTHFNIFKGHFHYH